MTMAALLSHFGIDTKRYVTTTGQIVFDGVSRVGSIYTHATLSRVTPVQPQTFHGGAEPSEAPPSDFGRWWQEDEEIQRHVHAMKDCFRGFTFVPAEGGLTPCWIGQIDTGRGRFTVAIILRTDRSLPTVTLVGGPRLGAHRGRRWVRSPHLYLNGNLCVAAHDDWDPHVHTAATVTSWAAHWLAAYTEWRFTDRWPVDGVHSVAS